MDTAGQSVFLLLVAYNISPKITGLTEVAHYVKDYFSHHTICSSSCSILVPGSDMRCGGCADYHLVLNAMLHWQRKLLIKQQMVQIQQDTKITGFNNFYVCN